MLQPIRKFKHSRRSNGAVCVEFALVAPIFFLVFFASIEFARIHMLQCAVENACFEGARRGIVPGATNSACRTTVEDLLEMAGLRNFSVDVEPSTIDATTESIQVTARVPVNADNGFGLSGFLNGESLVKEISMPCQRR